MDIFNKNKRKIKCIANDDRGGMCVCGYNATLLEIGKEYTLTDVEVHSYHTLIEIEEIPNKQFNSIYFSEV